MLTANSHPLVFQFTLNQNTRAVRPFLVWWLDYLFPEAMPCEKC